MNIGPKRDVVGEWAEQCRKYGLKLGVSMHGAHAWTFFEVGRDADTGVTKDEGTGNRNRGEKADAWYDMSGRNLSTRQHVNSSTLPKGVYIRNHRKEVIR